MYFFRRDGLLIENLDRSPLSKIFKAPPPGSRAYFHLFIFKHKWGGGVGRHLRELCILHHMNVILGMDCPKGIFSASGPCRARLILTPTKIHSKCYIFLWKSIVKGRFFLQSKSILSNRRIFLSKQVIFICEFTLCKGLIFVDMGIFFH